MPDFGTASAVRRGANHPLEDRFRQHGDAALGARGRFTVARRTMVAIARGPYLKMVLGRLARASKSWGEGARAYERSPLVRRETTGAGLRPA